MLPSELHEKAVRYAARRRLSLGQVVRTSLETALESTGNAELRDPLWADNETFHRTTPQHLARNHDRYLESD